MSTSPDPVVQHAERQRIGPLFVLVLSFVTLFLEGYDLIVFGSTVPALLDYEPWGLQTEQVGLLGSVAIIGMLVGALVAGVLTDILGRRTVIVSSVAMFSLASVGCALAPSVGVFTVSRLLVGLGAGALLPSVIALVIETAPAKRRNLYVTVAFAGTGLGGSVAALVALFFVPNGDFRPVYLIGALPAIVLIPVLVRYLPETKGLAHRTDRTSRTAGPTVRRQISSLFREGFAVPTLIFWAVTFLSLLTLFGATTWLPSLMTSAGYGVASALSFLLLLNTGGIVGALMASMLSDRIGPRFVLAGAFLSAAASFAALALQPPTVLVYILVAIAGFGAFGSQVLANAYVGASYPADRRATGLGFSLGVGRLGGIMGPILGGFLVAAELSNSVNFLVYAIPALIAAALVMLVRLPSSVGAATPIHNDTVEGRADRRESAHQNR